MIKLSYLPTLRKDFSRVQISAGTGKQRNSNKEEQSTRRNYLLSIVESASFYVLDLRRHFSSREKKTLLFNMFIFDIFFFFQFSPRS
jgi:hypothetical protein